MKELKTFEINFAENQDSFFPGDTVRGHVIIDVNKTMSVKGIRVKFKGRAEVTMFVGDYDTQKETYFNHDSLLFGTHVKEEGPLVDISPGLHEYPFGFKLPLSLPYSFTCEGDEHGIIDYSVTAIIYQPKKLAYTREKKFLVQGTLDLNTVRDAKEDVSGSADKLLSCLGWKCGTISATFSITKKGYVPGEAIDLYAEVTNNSSRRIKKTYVSLTQIVTLNVHGSIALRTKKVCCTHHGAIPPGGSDNWSGEPLVIPEPLPPSFLRGCERVDMQYQLKLVVVPAGCCSKLTVPLTIIIGTVPLTGVDYEQLAKAAAEAKMKRFSTVYDFGTYL